MESTTSSTRAYDVFYTFLSCPSAPLVGAYLLMAIFSKQLMSFYNPFDLRRVLVLHNLLCCVLSLVSLTLLLVGLWEVTTQFSDIYMLEHLSDTTLNKAFLLCWISKLFELTDTVYMVLRHKRRQISFLHVWHHSSVLLLADFGYHRTNYPALVPLVSLNCAVHVIMYGYYALTAVYPLRDFAWKKRITQMQMLQFVIAIFHHIPGYLYYGFCVYSVLYPLAMLSLFGNFYYRAFVAKRTKAPKDFPETDTSIHHAKAE